MLTPFPHTKAFDNLEKDKRILSYNWQDYSADKVVYQPKHMSPEKLLELFQYAWDTFYKDESQEYKMFKLLRQVMEKEKHDGTYQPRARGLVSHAFGKNLQDKKNGSH